MSKFKPGQSGNPTGRRKGSKNALTRATQEILQLNDLEMNRKFLRAVIVGDMNILSEFGVTTSPSATNKITASKELAKCNEQLVEADRILREARKTAKSKVTQTSDDDQRASFNPIATIISKTGTH